MQEEKRAILLQLLNLETRPIHAVLSDPLPSDPKPTGAFLVLAQKLIEQSSDWEADTWHPSCFVSGLCFEPWPTKPDPPIRLDIPTHRDRQDRVLMVREGCVLLLTSRSGDLPDEAVEEIEFTEEQQPIPILICTRPSVISADGTPAEMERKLGVYELTRDEASIKLQLLWDYVKELFAPALPMPEAKLLRVNDEAEEDHTDTCIKGDSLDVSALPKLRLEKATFKICFLLEANVPKLQEVQELEIWKEWRADILKEKIVPPRKCYPEQEMYVALIVSCEF